MLILKRKYFAAKHVNIAIEIEVVGCKNFWNKKCPNWCILGLCARFEHGRFSQVSKCLSAWEYVDFVGLLMVAKMAQNSYVSNSKFAWMMML